ncbi:MAG: hypothetical protein HY819_21090 [Acidobacteria bacterium]|nr:hypothetical protein [Acidobacteriota bacterium]
MIQIQELSTEELICQNFKSFGLIALVLIALVLPFGHQQLKNIEKLFNKIAYKRELSILLVGLLAFIGAAIVSITVFWPIPHIIDERSYLLAADTFSHWRLTNPAHPMWMHFETLYVLQQPTYMSQYPPAQGLILALGQILTGYPIVGAWIATALACSALCWMLQAWINPRWALMGGLLMVLKLGLFSYWSQSFWGGAIAATGGAILLGAFRRTIKQPKIFNSLLIGLGLGILANSRPYEGLAFSLPSITYLLFWIKGKNSPPLKILLKEIILPLTAILLVIGFMMGYYNFVITGKFWLMPFQLYQDTYSTISNFLWSKPRLDLKYNHKEFYEIYYGSYLDLYNSNIGLSNYLSFSFMKMKNLWAFFLGVSFSLPLIALPALRKNFWVRFALLNLLLLIIGMLLVLYNFPHYAAPGTCLIYFLVLQSIRRIYFFQWKNRPVGKMMTWAVPIYCILQIALPVSLRIDPYVYINPAHWEIAKSQFPTWIYTREELVSKLSEGDDRYLILVKYLPDRNGHNEWVYNLADIDSTKVIWARSMSAEKDCQLAKYFSDRKIRVIEIGSQPNPIKRSYPFKPCD